MNKFMLATLVLVTITVLTIPFTACNSTSELIPLSNNSAKAEASTNDYEARISELENRVALLEQGLDERVIEFNMIQSAIWEMIIDNKLGYGIPGDTFPYTNDMRQFPSSTAPLYGYDKNGDGKPDINYVPFEKTVWFYQAGSHVPDLIIQGCDPKLIESWQREIGKGQEEAKQTELHNVQTAVLAAMADAGTGNVTGPSSISGDATAPFDFGDTDEDPATVNNDDVLVCTVGTVTYNVGDYIIGQEPSVQGHYEIATDGYVTQLWYPGD